MSYAANKSCSKCNQLTITGKDLPCGKFLCNDCAAKCDCICSICSDRERNTLVPRKVCKDCSTPAISSNAKECLKCKSSFENSGSIWDFLWSLGSKISCSPLPGSEHNDEKEQKEEELHTIYDQSGNNPVKYIKGITTIDFSQSDSRPVILDQFVRK